MPVIVDGGLDLLEQTDWRTLGGGSRYWLWLVAGMVFLSLGCRTSSTAPVSTATPVQTAKPLAILQQTPTPMGASPILPVQEHYWRGNPNAQVVIEEWTDLQ